MAVPTEHWEQLKSLFLAALEVEAAQRTSFLEKRCREGNIRTEVERLLMEHDRAETFLSTQLLQSDFASQPQAPYLGSYQMLELIGEGGMGQVWLAEQKHPVRRRVAIKLTKPGMATREVVSRFESERQALALMDHPAIAKVFDAGTTVDGRPYFVMEYVAGLPITTYCDKHKLAIRDRMELFLRVCEGVQHAHQKAVIHRDLKPTNILVTETDGKLWPRIIDFGVAKATSQRLSAGTIHTQLGALIGTLNYMSPEQADYDGQDIDTRTDIYSLGIVLYELLTGALPLDLNKLPYDEVLRRLRDQDPQRPSTRLTTLGEAAEVAARNRCAEVATLVRLLRGDADLIALKTIEKDRNRRYASASDLGADITRYLNNEPVTAHAPDTGYRLGKYIRRHRLGVVATFAFVLMLVTVALAQSIAIHRIRTERDRATRERDRADRIAQFMTGMFKVSDPREARGTTVTAREILDKASTQIDTGLRNDPELQADLMQTMADTYLGLALLPQAEQLTRRALDIRNTILGPLDPKTLDSMRTYAQCLSGKANFLEAAQLYSETIAKQRQVLGPENRETLRTMQMLAVALFQDGNHRQAAEVAGQALTIDQRSLGSDDKDTVASMQILALALASMQRMPEAERLEKQILTIRLRTLGRDDPDTLKTESYLAEDINIDGRHAEAEAMLREVLEVTKRIYGSDHPATARLMHLLARCLMDQGRYQDAEPLARKALDIDRSWLGETHTETLDAQTLLGAILAFRGRYKDAGKLYRDAISKSPSAGARALAWYDYACTAARLGRREDAYRFLAASIVTTVNADWMAADPDLTSLHGEPRFEALVTKARQRDAVATSSGSSK
jgi:serine/threonine protein kinase